MSTLRILRLFSVACAQTIIARLRHGPIRPSWHFMFEWVVRFLRLDFASSAHWRYSQLRADLDKRPGPRRAQRQVEIREELLGGIPTYWYSPKTIRPRGVLLFFHGGSYIFGSARTTHAELLARLALASGAAVVGPDYRLAPEHPYPAALDDARRVYDALLQRGLSHRAIVVAGDSAGGNLALALQLRLRDEARAQAAAAVLISPWLDLTASSPSCRALEPFDYGRTDFLLVHARDFAGSLPLEDARVSLIHRDLRGLSPLFVQVGSTERLYDEGVRLIALAQEAGVDATLDVAEDMPHNPPVLASYHPAARAALENIAGFVRQRLERGAREGSAPSAPARLSR